MKPQYDHAVTFLWVTMWEEANRFYTDVLGFSRDYESEGWAEYSVPGLEDTYFALNHWVKEQPHPVNSFITLRVSDIRAFRAHLEEQSVELMGPIQEFMEEGQGLSMFKFKDLDGNILTAAQIHT